MKVASLFSVMKGKITVSMIVPKDRVERLRLILIVKAGGKCLKCGFDDVRALVIHHAKHDRTEDQLSELRLMYLGKRKYQVLCENCHTIITKEHYHHVPRFRKAEKLRDVRGLEEFREERRIGKEQLLNTLNGILHEVRKLDDNLPALVRSFVQHQNHNAYRRQ
jgi:hypothetical protein